MQLLTSSLTRLRRVPVIDRLLKQLSDAPLLAYLLGGLAGVGLERAAGEWLRREQMPAAALLGASHLMSTASRPAALETLNQLAAHSDQRVALLAYAQTWRAAVVTARDEQLTRWCDTIERMPEPLRPGPYYVLGLARAHRQQWDEAALAWLRIPILYPTELLLASRALLDAGRSLEKLNRPGQAARLYRELADAYQRTPAEAEARRRLQELHEAGRDEG